MSKILLIYPQVNFETNYETSWVPYSILSIASSINLFLPDCKIDLFDENKQSILVFKDLIKKSKYDIVGISIMTGGQQIANALKLAEFVRVSNKETKIVFGGPHVNVMGEQTLEHDLIDDVLIGPGQNSFPLYIQYIKEKIDYNLVPGLISKRNGKYFFGPHNYLTPKSMVPYQFDLIDLNNYVRSDDTISDRVINYIASQGCVYGCRFCYENGTYNRKYCSIQHANVSRDLEYFYSKYKINGIKFSDADFFVNKKQVEGIIQTLEDLNMKWSASMHPNDIRTGLSMKNIANSGCTRLLMGIESGSDRVLSSIINKGTTVSQILNTCKKIADAGIIGSYTFVVGFPGETAFDQEKTFKLIEKLWQLQPCPETKVHLFYPYPGTQLFKESCDNGFAPPESLVEWSKANYYKANTPWVSKELEIKAQMYTKMRFMK